MVAKLSPTKMRFQHGTVRGFAVGCRCKFCQAAMTRYAARISHAENEFYRPAFREDRTPYDHPKGYDGVPHGRPGGFQYWLCVCGICLEGKAEYAAAQKARRALAKAAQIKTGE